MEPLLQQAVSACLPDAETSGVLVRPCADLRFGDYQTAGLISLAKERRLNPREFAAKIAGSLNLPGWVDKLEVAGPGFLNFRLSKSVLEDTLAAAVRGEHLFFEPAREPRTVVIDFSSPNVAKPMHVGHIRSTILGDSLARTARLLGHRVITDNHIGDWGTQFGKLLLGWKEELDRLALRKDPIAEMERIYRKVNAACDADSTVLNRARQELVELQAGGPENLAIWREMLALSQSQFDAIYRRLGVVFDFALGESFYNPRLKSVVQELCSSGLARESEGAIAVFFEDIPELKAHPALIQKSDGAANYTTTDLATLQYRIQTWNPSEIIYVTDGRQQLHFKQLFAIFRKWHPETPLRLTHVWFGSILGEDGKPFKTREGGTIKLADLLDEAEERAFRVVTEKNPGLDENQRREIARIVGIGAIKYADLLPNRQSDYVFSWEKMLALNGNTAPYLLYAYARIRSIFRKRSESADPDERSLAPPPSGYTLSTEEEIALVKHLLNFGLVLESVIEEYRPNYLCNFLYDLAGHFTRFYEKCPVLKADEPQRQTRLAICDLTSRVLKQGLDLLGIETIEHM
ncbi:MAG: arginine--tRNA ligase [Verrucomicrobia bacterium]|nr:arginine--tRNA ligase [Verrucomicrobiota bacterium]